MWWVIVRCICRERERERKRGMEQRDCTICVLCQLYVSSACVYSQNQNIRCICRERERERKEGGNREIVLYVYCVNCTWVVCVCTVKIKMLVWLFQFYIIHVWLFNFSGTPETQTLLTITSAWQANGSDFYCLSHRRLRSQGRVSNEG